MLDPDATQVTASPEAEAILADLQRYDSEPIPQRSNRGAPKNEADTAPQLPADPKDLTRDENKTPDSSEPEAESETRGTEDKVRDDKGRFVAKDANPTGDPAAEKQEPDATPKAEVPDTTDKQAETPDKPESNFERAKKEQERRERSWQRLEEEKKAIREEAERSRQDLARQRAELQQQLQQASQPQQRKVTSKEYLDYGRELAKKAARGENGPNGEDYADLSEKAFQAAEVSNQQEQQSAQTAWEKLRDTITFETFQANPDLQNQESPLAKEMPAVYALDNELAKKFGTQPVLTHSPYGFAAAVEIAKLRQAATSASGLRDQLNKAQAEIERLNKLTGVNGSSPTAPTKVKSYEDMTPDDAMAQMDRLARAAGANFAVR